MARAERARRAQRFDGAGLGVVALGLAACGGGFGEPSQAPPAMALADGQRLPEPVVRYMAKRAQPTIELNTNTSSTAPAPAPAPAPEPAPVPAPEPEPEPEKQRSALLPSGFYNPMPGGVFAGYRADTGLDIAGSPRPVYAIAAGTLDYSEPGHTLWTGPTDTANSIRFKLDKPIPWKGRQITHVYYSHLSKLEYQQAEGSKERIHIQGGELLGMSGKARGSPHLHIGLLLDGEVEQYSGTYLFEDEIRQLLGGYKNGKALPKEAPAKEKEQEKAPEPAR